MRAALIRRQGDPVAPNVEVVTDHPTPSPGPGEVLIRVEAAALNHLDLWVGRGVPGLPLDYPRISGSDGCGRVEEVGAGVDAAWIGRRVIVNAAVVVNETPSPGRAPALDDLRMLGEHDPGFMAEYAVAPASNLLPIDGIDPVEGAAYGLTHLTAWRMLVTNAGLVEGQTVLVTGIGGGVALAALAIARHYGARVIVTSRHQWKLDRAAELGAAHCIIDEGEDWAKQVRAATGGRGVDVCVDSIGKAVHGACMKSLVRGGAYVTCGCTSGPIAPVNLAAMFWLQQRMIGSTMGSMDEFRRAVALLTAGRVRPVIDRVVDADDAPDAYAHLETGTQFGKVVVRWR